MTTERHTEYCRNCRMETTFTPRLEPLVATMTVFDCRGRSLQRPVGLDAITCDVCGRTTVDDLLAGGTFNAAQSQLLNQTFCVEATSLAVDAQLYLVAYGRRQLCLATAGMFGVLLVLDYVAPQLQGLALLVPAFVGAWTLSFGLRRHVGETAYISNWISARPKARQPGQKGKS